MLEFLFLPGVHRTRHLKSTHPTKQPSTLRFKPSNLLETLTRWSKWKWNPQNQSRNSSSFYFHGTTSNFRNKSDCMKAVSAMFVFQSCVFRSRVFVIVWLGLGKNMRRDNNKLNLNLQVLQTEMKHEQHCTLTWNLLHPPRFTSPAQSSCATPAAFSPGVLRAVWTVHPVDVSGTWAWRPSDAPLSRVLCSLLGRRFPWQPWMSAATVWGWNRARHLRKVNMPSIYDSISVCLTLINKCALILQLFFHQFSQTQTANQAKAVGTSWRRSAATSARSSLPVCLWCQWCWWPWSSFTSPGREKPKIASFWFVLTGTTKPSPRLHVRDPHVICCFW